MLDEIAKGLKAKLNATLVDKLLEAYQDAKHNFYVGGLRLNAVQGGRFCETALRLLEQVSTGTFTPLNKQLHSEKIIVDLANLTPGSQPDSIRIHIPRAIRVVYDIRNKRNAAHLNDGIDPNFQDAALIVGVLDWIMAEFVRIYHGISADKAQLIIDSLVARRVPAIQDFEGFLKVLNPKLKASEHVILCLYERGKVGATYAELELWVRPKMRANLKTTLARLVDSNDLVHFDGKKYILTKLGMAEVEKKKLHHLD